MALKLYTDLLNALYEFTSSQASDFNAYGGTIDTVVTFAENRIFRELRCREMEQTLTSTVTISAGVVALPSNYVELKYARLTNESPSIPLTKRSASWIYERYPYRAASSMPRFIARENGNFIFGPYPNSGTTYTIGGVYWGMYELPLFPLNTVLFPGMPLHLHIFEDRYKKMVSYCRRTNSAFGVVLIQSGVEAHGPLAKPYHIGCTAHITHIQPLKQGRINLAAIGLERFKVLTLKQGQIFGWCG